MSRLRSIRRKQERKGRKASTEADKHRRRVRSYFALLYKEMQQVPADHPYRQEIDEGFVVLREVMAYWTLPDVAPGAGTSDGPRIVLGAPGEATPGEQ